MLGSVPCGALVTPAVSHAGLDLRRRSCEQVGARCRVLVEQAIDGDAVLGSRPIELNVLAGPTPLDQPVILRPLGGVEVVARPLVVEAIYRGAGGRRDPRDALPAPAEPHKAPCLLEVPRIEMLGGPLVEESIYIGIGGRGGGCSGLGGCSGSCGLGGRSERAICRRLCRGQGLCGSRGRLHGRGHGHGAGGRLNAHGRARSRGDDALALPCGGWLRIGVSGLGSGRRG